MMNSVNVVAMLVESKRTFKRGCHNAILLEPKPADRVLAHDFRLNARLAREQKTKASEKTDHDRRKKGSPRTGLDRVTGQRVQISIKFLGPIRV